MRAFGIGWVFAFIVAIANAAELPKIRIAADGRHFETAEGKPFVPFGVTYYRPGTGWAPQVWKQFDAEATRKDFARMKEAGVNCARVFLSYGSFCMTAGTLDTNGLARFDQFLEIAEHAGIYVHPTGPDHWEGTADWAREDRIASDQALAGLEAFWRDFAARYRNRPVIFACDLRNEPEVAWDTPSMRAKWKKGVPDPKKASADEILEYQHFREGLADEWTRRQVAAIKAADPKALVSVGFVQWSVPSLLPGIEHYAAFRPERQAPMLDFLEVHFYPLEHGAYEYRGLDDEARNLAYLESVVAETARPGKPVVLAEFGWYGGGKPKFDQGKHPFASEEQQARWCRRVVETTAGLATGWLNWGFYDQPEAGDCSEFTGLYTADGKEKAWGREFRKLAARAPSPAPRGARPQLNWDRALVSAVDATRFREENLQAFKRDQPKLKLAGAEIIVAENAAAPTRHAAEELAKTLEAITGVANPIKKEASGGPAILVGGGKDLRDEEIVLQCSGDRLQLAGGGARGDFYAVSRFLQEECGVRWWTPWASRIPKNPELTIGPLDKREQPAFELREPFWMPAFDPTWAMRNGCNGQSANIPDDLGGSVRYKGFVHTFYPLVPPEKYFNDHPEWFSLIKGKRTHDRAQLCLTNPKLRAFLVERVKEWLRESPDARIISVSQNDWYGACECENCQALDEREGSHSGTMLDAVNFVAEQIEKEFPNVSVDTLAYQYTRKPPKTLRPRKNVIVRLCSIECNFREPLEHSSNAAFADDIKGWSAITDRLYVWDYTTDFAHYVQPHPNWFTLGANVRFFANHHVRGLFEQGAYQSHGSEMAELRAWVLAQLLWNPKQDDRALIREFLDGYYGAAPAQPIYDYLALMSDASKGFYLGCFSNVKAAFLNSQTLARAEKLWAKAEAAAQNDPELLSRVRLGRLPLTYVWLARWDDLRKEATESDLKWPLADSKQTVGDQFLKVTKGEVDKPWTHVTRLNEAGLAPEAFLKRISGN